MLYTDLVGPSVEYEDNVDSRGLKTFLIQTLNGINNYVFSKDDKRLMLPQENVTQMSFWLKFNTGELITPGYPITLDLQIEWKKILLKIRKRILGWLNNWSHRRYLNTVRVCCPMLKLCKIPSSRGPKKFSLSLLEGRQSVKLYSKSGTPPSLNDELDISSPNFIALGESYFIVKLKCNVKDNLNASPGEYTNWIYPTSPAFSWFKNIRVELDGTEVTQSSKISDMQIVQHIMSLMESRQTSVFGLGPVWLAKVRPSEIIEAHPLANYEYRAKLRRGYAFETNSAGGDADANPDIAADFKLKRAPTIPLETFEGYGNTVLERCRADSFGSLTVQDASFHSFLQRGRCLASSSNSGEDQIRPTTDGAFSVHDYFGQRQRSKQRRTCWTGWHRTFAAGFRLSHLQNGKVLRGSSASP